MDLNQSKLTKSEWESIEVPVSEDEKSILELIIQGYNNVNIRKNKYNSLFTYLKIDYGLEMEDHLYNKYFSDQVRALNDKFPHEFLTVSVNISPTVKKADIIRIEKNTPEKMKTSSIYEYLLLDIAEKILKYRTKKGVKKEKWLLQYFTLYKLFRNNIPHINRHINNIIQSLLSSFEDELDIHKIVGSSVELIEKNLMLLKYADQVLYEHQKQLFTVMRSPKPKLVLYIAPTGTGKTLSPIGLSENKRIIFVCAARHVGLALARSAISVDKKVAFAFGCASAADIRLHYFSAKEYTKNWKSGGIWKVDNSIGDKVEIMICDVKSYLPAMYYMAAFNSVNNIITYWDEPTITMDYEDHELHETIQKNWCENIIPNMILSSATLPKLHELTSTTADFRSRFMDAEIHNILSSDCKKSIPIINKYGYVVMPHALSEEHDTVKEIVNHCLENQTLLRYLDLTEAVRFIEYVETTTYIPNNVKLSRHITSLEDVTMSNIKLHYLRLLNSIIPGTWASVYLSMKQTKTKRILPNDTIDNKGNTVRKVYNMTETAEKKVLNVENDCAIYVTTKDAYTLTDGPTLFLANDVAKIAKFCIQQANIPTKVMEDIMEKIEFNNTINEKIVELEHKVEDYIEKHSMKEQGATDNSLNKKNKSNKESKMSTNNKDPELNKMYTDLDVLRSAIKSAELNETFIPNKDLHLKKWITSQDIKNAFTSEIDEETILDIMMLTDIQNSWKILLLMGIGVFTSHTSDTYMEIMKKLADQQKLYMIIASSDYIYGTNYQFCHGYLSKDLDLTQEKIIQALGRIGRNNIQQDYSVRLRDDEQVRKLFYREEDKMEVRNMNKLFCQ